MTAFGRALLHTQDLDPLYVALWRAELEAQQLRRFLLAFWCFYHAGVAALLSEAEGADFYRLAGLADRQRFPRGAERRHFRGSTSANALEYLQRAFPEPGAAVESLTRGGAAAGALQVMALVEAWPGFGPWIAFKAADMLERLALAPVRFEAADLAFYREPTAGALLAAPELGVPLPSGQALLPSSRAARGVVGRVVDALLRELGGLHAPPRYERAVNAQEAETVLCKWKAHRAGHYPVGKDSRELAAALLGAPPAGAAGWNSTARTLAGLLPRAQP